LLVADYFVVSYIYLWVCIVINVLCVCAYAIVFGIFTDENIERVAILFGSELFIVILLCVCGYYARFTGFYINGITYKINVTNSNGIVVTDYDDDTVEELVIPNKILGKKVTAIGDNVFKNYLNLVSITIPDSVTTIGDSAFYNCKSLTDINLPDSVTTIGNFAYYGCSGLTKIKIPYGVTAIGSSVFYNCDNLTDISLPDNVMAVGNCAFYGCSKLNYNMSDNAKYLGNESNPYLVIAEITDKEISTFTLKDETKIIYGSAFDECVNVTEIVITKGINFIGPGAFADCKELASITVDIANRYYTSVNNCIIKKSTKTLIVGCNYSTIPSDGSVTAIGDYAFDGCNRLNNITLSDNVTSIGDYAFAHCSSLTSITYMGTKGQWAAINKSTYWNNGTGEYTIYCTDGEISK
jgi:hypothetical protein